MSIQGAMTAYEKMLENPANRRSSAGELKQATPGMSEAEGGSPMGGTPTIEDADDLWVKELDKRIARKKNMQEQIGTPANNDLVLNELREVKEMLKMVLDVNLKLLKK